MRLSPAWGLGGLVQSPVATPGQCDPGRAMPPGSAGSASSSGNEAGTGSCQLRPAVGTAEVTVPC